MRKVSGLVAAGLLLATTGCVEDSYPSYGYGYSPGYYNSGYSDRYYYPSGYYSQPGYYSRPTYYSTYSPPPTVVTQTRYVPVPVSSPPPRPMRDRNHDGIPDRYQRDRNHDGVPDYLQR